jgi:hypothetical protein
MCTFIAYLIGDGLDCAVFHQSIDLLAVEIRNANGAHQSLTDTVFQSFPGIDEINVLKYKISVLVLG